MTLNLNSCSNPGNCACFGPALIARRRFGVQTPGKWACFVPAVVAAIRGSNPGKSACAVKEMLVNQIMGSNPGKCSPGLLFAVSWTLFRTRSAHFQRNFQRKERIMAMVRSSRRTASILTRIATACCTSRPASSLLLSSSVERSSSQFVVAPAAPPFPVIRSFSSAPSWRSSITTMMNSAYPSGMAVVRMDSTVVRTSWLPWIAVRPYSKRPKKWQGGPHAYVQVEPGAPCPPYSPNAGSVKKRKHNKRMAQRHAFAKAQAHQRKQETTAALIKRDAARRKRWREAAARARAWAKHLQQQQGAAVSA